MVDKHGNTVRPAVIDGLAVFIVRDQHGYVLHNRSNGLPNPRTPEDLVALGVDLASLQKITSPR